MKGFQKLALAAAISAAPFAQAELVSIDDSALSDMTGQAGVTIELSANVEIGSIVYTDTDGGANGAGTLGINGIVLGGNDGAGNVTGALDEIKIDIDVDGSDGLIIHLGGTNNLGVIAGTAPVDFGLSVASVNLNSTATLASAVSIAGNLGPIDVAIANDATIGVKAYFEVTHGSLDVDVMGVGITNLTIGDDASPILSGDYAATMAGVQGLAVAANSATISGAGDAAVAGMTDLDSDGFDDDTGLDATDTRAAGEAAATSAVQAGAVAGVSNMAYVGMTIQTANTDYVAGDGSTVNISDALNINIDAMNMDIGMDVAIGGGSIGNVAINDLDLSGTSLTIYGH